MKLVKNEKKVVYDVEGFIRLPFDEEDLYLAIHHIHSFKEKNKQLIIYDSYNEVVYQPNMTIGEFVRELNYYNSRDEIVFEPEEQK